MSQIGTLKRVREIGYRRVPADDIFRLAGEAIIAGRSKNQAAVGAIVARMHVLFADAASYQYAQIYAQAGDKTRAFAALAKALEVKDPGMTGIRTDPFLDPLRTDPRFAALVKRMNLPTMV